MPIATMVQPSGLASPLLLAEALVLVSIWKPLLLLLPFVPWAWMVSKVLDKHAARFFLERERWNAIHLSVALAAILMVVFMPLRNEGAFWLAFLGMIVMLTLDVVIFALVTNRDERVPADFRLTLDFSKWQQARAAKAAAKKQGKVELVIKAPDKSVLAPPVSGTPEFDVRLAAEQVIVTHLVDGVRQTASTMPAADAARLLAFWKGAAKMDVADQRRRQQADINVERGETRRKVRMTSVGSQAGPRLAFLFDPEGQVRRKIEALGLLEPPQLTAIKEMVEDGQGLVILAGGPDSGRTTTMYTIVKMHDAYTKNVQTIETEIQDSLEGVRQTKWDAQAEGAELSTTVRSVIRRDPSVLAVAEVPDTATAKEIVRAEIDRTRTYACLKADGAMAAIQAWVKLVGETEAAVKPLKGVVAQKTLRKLCTNCRVAYQPSADMAKKLGLPADKVKQLFKKGGQVLIKNKPEVCPVCSGVGYIGQEGAFEVYSIGEAERGMIRSGDFAALRSEWRKKGLPSIQQAALRKALDGITSVEEVMRVTAEPAPAAAPAKA
jgi:type II secretory ATPase GspE/PulE/Tfp pilus assembly ATPase PilB-like protein